jgi:aspartate/methionine/tyrosine aminotransferase
MSRTLPNGLLVNEMPSWLDAESRHNLAESTVGEMSFEGLLSLLGPDALREMRLGYTASAGLPALREAIGRRYNISPKIVLTTQGATQELFLLAFELCRPGDDVLLSVPCFALAHDTLVRCGVRLRVVRRNFEESYRLDPYHLADAMTSSTRLISIASPHNPSGICVPQADIQLILAAMSSRCPNAFLFVDESYGAASYGEAPALASMASLDARVIVGSSLSKAHALPGLRCGWLTVPCVSLFERLTLAKMNMIISGSALDESLAAALLERGDEVLRPARRKLSRALNIVSSWHACESSRLDWVRPHAGAMCCMRLPPVLFDAERIESFWERVSSHGLRLAVGTWFGDERRVFRIGFGTLEQSELEAALLELSLVLDESVGPISGRGLSH